MRQTLWMLNVGSSVLKTRDVWSFSVPVFSWKLIESITGINQTGFIDYNVQPLAWTEKGEYGTLMEHESGKKLLNAQYYEWQRDTQRLAGTELFLRWVAGENPAARNFVMDWLWSCEVKMQNMNAENTGCVAFPECDHTSGRTYHEDKWWR